MNRLEFGASLYTNMIQHLRKDAPFTQAKIVGELWFGVGEYSLGPQIVKRGCV